MSANNAIKSSPARDAIRAAMFAQRTPRQQAHYDRLRKPKAPVGTSGAA